VYNTQGDFALLSMGKIYTNSHNLVMCITFTDDFYRLRSKHSIDIKVCVTSAEHIKCAINDDSYRAVFDA